MTIEFNWNKEESDENENFYYSIGLEWSVVESKSGNLLLYRLDNTAKRGEPEDYIYCGHKFLYWEEVYEYIENHP